MKMHATRTMAMAMILSIMALAAHAGELSLQVKPLTEGGKVTALEVRQQIENAGRDNPARLRFKAPIRVFGVKRIADTISALSVVDAKGPVPLVATDDTTSTNGYDAYRHWEAARDIAYPVALSYRIPTQPADERKGPPYGMKAAGGGVAGSGYGFLLLPENGASTATRMHWDLSQLPNGSVGVMTAGEGDVVVAGPPSEMTTQWMLAGPAQIRVSQQTPGFRAYMLGTPPFNGTRAMAWADRGYGLLARSLGYLGAPPYHLLFRVLDGPDYSTGTARTDGGGALMTIGNTLGEQSLDAVYTTIFHEMTHQWVGSFDGDASWFMEGLTTYLAAVLPCQNGLADGASCAAAINDYARQYYGSIARNWSLEQITATVGREDVRRVPYGRGLLYFARLNAQLLAHSGGKRTLLTALAPLFEERRNGKVLDQARWEAMLRRELGDAAVVEFRASVIDGSATIVPPSDAFGPCLARTAIEIPRDGGQVAGYAWQPVACSRASS